MTALSASALAQMIRDAGVPCVTLAAGEAAAAAVPTPRDEGLRVADGTMPVRIAYPIPPAGADGYHAALRRRDSHVLWLFDFAERHRWSAHRDADDEWIIISPEPRPATYRSGSTRGGQEVARHTGRPVEENLGSWVVVRIVYDAAARADAIEAEVAAETARMPKNRRAVTAMQQQRLDSAVRIRAEGPQRAVHSSELSRDRAYAHLDQCRQDPGVRYEAAPVTASAACLTCYCPVIEADGQWWHHTGGYPAQCPGPRPPRDLPLEPGDWEFSAISMVCGYCGENVSWAELNRSWVKLTGAWMLGVQIEVPETGAGSAGHRGDLVVLAETEGIARRPGQRDVLPHHCEKIPAGVRAEYADEIARLAETPPGHGNHHEIPTAEERGK